jgi:hypothetical protein
MNVTAHSMSTVSEGFRNMRRIPPKIGIFVRRAIAKLRSIAEKLSRITS